MILQHYQHYTKKVEPANIKKLTGSIKIWLYTFRQWSLEQADDYHNSIIAAVEGLAAGRKIWQRTDVREGYWKYKVGLHVIYFQCSNEFLDVIRILHGRMDVELQLQE